MHQPRQQSSNDARTVGHTRGSMSSTLVSSTDMITGSSGCRGPAATVPEDNAHDVRMTGDICGAGPHADRAY